MASATAIRSSVTGCGRASRLSPPNGSQLPVADAVHTPAHSRPGGVRRHIRGPGRIHGNGIGILEQLAIGSHPTGLTGILDPFTPGDCHPWRIITAIAFAAVKKPTVAERRNEILETTCEVVIERGFAGTRIADVAKRLEVSSSLIHYHFDSKEQLLAEAFDYYANKDVAEMEGEIENAPTALGKLERVIQNYVPEGSDDVEWMLWIDGWGEALRNPMMRKISQQLDEQSIELLARIIRDGVESGEFTCPDPNAAAMRLTALGRRPGRAVRRARRDDEPRSADRPRSVRGRCGGRCHRLRFHRRPPPCGSAAAIVPPPTPRCATWPAATAMPSTVVTLTHGQARGPRTQRGPGWAKQSADVLRLSRRSNASSTRRNGRCSLHR